MFFGGKFEGLNSNEVNQKKKRITLDEDCPLAILSRQLLEEGKIRELTEEERNRPIDSW